MTKRAQINKLIRMSGGLCHYCDRPVNIRDFQLYPTRDHVVPKAFGGENHMDNYVLAHRKCNNERGTNLFYCKCRDCMEKIYDALYEPEQINKMFNGIIAHNKPVVKKTMIDARGGGRHVVWSARIGHNQKHFDTFEEAVHFATTGTFTHDKEYK